MILGLGSNLGDRAGRLRKAVALIESRGLLTRSRRSSIVVTPALLPEGAPPEWNVPFLNLAVAGETSLSPVELLAAVKKIELELGRVARGRWAPREIDIDILAWRDQTYSDPSLSLFIPHPGLLEREFALGPLAELEGSWRFPSPGPSQGKTAAELALRFQAPPRLVGIVNVTPDSFSDGGPHLEAAAAIARAAELVEQGACVLDVGAESTRPGATPLTAREEWQRLEPVLAGIAERNDIKTALLSIDTRHPETARRALAVGADWINDVSGLADPEMRRVVADSAADCVIMHSLTVPADRNVTLAEGVDPIEAVLAWGETRLCELERDGIARDRVILDPGIGFGKTAAQSLAILKGADRLSALGARVLLGHSRKSFLSLFTGVDFAERDVETLAASLALAGKGIDYLRVHNVDWHARAFGVSRALRARA